MTVENWCYEAQKNVSEKRKCNLEKSWYKIIKEASVKVVGLRSGQTGVSTLPGRAAKLDVIAQNLRHILAKLSFWFSLVLRGHNWEKPANCFFFAMSICRFPSTTLALFGLVWFKLFEFIKKSSPSSWRLPKNGFAREAKLYWMDYWISMTSTSFGPGRGLSPEMPQIC